MKKLLAFISALSLMTTAFAAMPVSAEEEATTVYVTISDASGALVLVQEPTVVTDIDGDGALTIHDALYIAHEDNYDGGAAEGYAADETAYGLSMTTLWGTTNGGSYGYYVNHVSAWSLEDVVSDGDYINAFVYTDLETWSDTYSYFDVNTVKVAAGEDITLTLSASGYDENWDAIALPVSDATITVDGEETEYTTDEDGTVTLNLMTEGTFVISATSADTILVPPVCTVTVYDYTYEGTYGDSFTADLSEIAGDAISFSAEGLPEGLSLDAETGIISGTPEAACPEGEQITLSMTDAEGTMTELMVKIIIAKATPGYGESSRGEYTEGDAVPAVTEFLSSSVPGTFTWVDAPETLSVGENVLTWQFTPEDTNNYETITGKSTFYAVAASTSVTDEGETEDTDIILGDLNYDEEISISDASDCLIAYANHAAGNDYDLTDAQLLAADVDQDGEITIMDALYILQFYANTSAGNEPTWDDILGTTVHTVFED